MNKKATKYTLKSKIDVFPIWESAKASMPCRGIFTIQDYLEVENPCYFLKNFGKVAQKKVNDFLVKNRILDKDSSYLKKQSKASPIVDKQEYFEKLCLEYFQNTTKDKDISMSEFLKQLKLFIQKKKLKI